MRAGFRRVQEDELQGAFELQGDQGLGFRDFHIYIYILGLYRANGKENGNYYLGLRD